MCVQCACTHTHSHECLISQSAGWILLLLYRERRALQMKSVCHSNFSNVYAEKVEHIEWETC